MVVKDNIEYLILPSYWTPPTHQPPPPKSTIHWSSVLHKRSNKIYEYLDYKGIIYHRIYDTFLCALFVVDVETPHHIYSLHTGWESLHPATTIRLINQSSYTRQSAITVTIIPLLSVVIQSSGIISVISPMDHAWLLPVRWLAKGYYNTDKLFKIVLYCYL